VSVLLVVSGVIALVSLAACASEGEAGSEGSSDEPVAETSALKIRTVVRAPLAVGITFDAKGRLVYAEKDTGRIIRVSKGRKSVLTRLNVAPYGEAGLLGIAIDKQGRYFASYTGGVDGCPNPTRSGSAGNGIEAHCIWRFAPTSSGKLRADKRIFSENHISATENHNGGGIHFDADGALLYGLGDGGENDDETKGPSRSQSVDQPWGKMLRLDPDGYNKGAAGNPGYCNNVENDSKRTAGDDRIFACGLRNVWEFAVARDGRIWGAEAGDGCDEINIVRSGVNYGWRPPRTDCSGVGPGKAVIEAPGTPSGIDVWEHAAAGSWRNDVFYCTYANGGKLMHYDVSAKRRRAIRSTEGKCLLDLTAGRRGIYFSDMEKIYRLTR
jgi:glucose/arabinose dehydrogenase